MVGWAIGCVPDGLPADVHPMDLPDPVGHHERVGAVEMVPPVHFPQPASGTVGVWLRLPDDAALDTVVRDDGQTVLSYPPGTAADRVETRGSGDDLRVVDVRGTRIDDEGRRWHHVFRPIDADPIRPLVGVEWPADEPELQRIAVDHFLARLRDGGIRSGLDDVRSKLDCDGCHTPLRLDNRTVGEFGVVARGTDAAGWFAPSTVLHDEVPLERYGALDPNRDDPFVTVVCEDCPVRRATLALEAALADRDPHAEAVCRSWRTLALHLALPSDHPCQRGSP